MLRIFRSVSQIRSLAVQYISSEPEGALPEDQFYLSPYVGQDDRFFGGT